MKTLTGLLVFSISTTLSLAACPHEGVTNLWSNPKTWDNGVIPGDHADLIITKPILLESDTAKLGAIVIKDGGQLVFSPNHDVALTADSIYIQNEGRMDIGSEDCPYTRRALITLTGIRTGEGDDSQPGENKFIAVGSGGSLEIHGEQDRLAFTQLAETFEPHKMDYDSIIEGQAARTDQISFLEFTQDGKLIQRVDNIWETPVMLETIQSTQSDSVILMGKYWGMNSQHFDGLSSILSTELLNGEESLLATLEHPANAWALIMDKKTGTIVQDIDDWIENDTDGCNTDWLEVQTNSEVFRIRTRTRKYNEINIEVYPKTFFDYTIPVVGDISSWRAGDEIVITSTDYDQFQAEEFTILGIEGQNIIIKDKPLYTHFGEIYETVDMRAEVGLLTRNIKITAELEGEPCVGTEWNALETCKAAADEDEDGLYGGHTVALEGFKSYNIRGAEFRYMGQNQILSRYPIHFHMAHDTRRDGKFMKISGNSIRDSFSRCITIHGSHHVQVIDNVAKNHFGHCIFIEDGGEKETLIEGNLVLGTKKGELTQSDNAATSYWITSPLTTVRNNVAAGSVHTGFWWLFPEEPVGPSKGLGFFKRGEAKRTPMKEVIGNRAHSNQAFGLAIFNRLGENHEIIGCSTYEPREDPLNSGSLLVPVYFKDIHAYKNRDSSIRSRIRTSIWSDIHIAESRVGFHFFRNLYDGYQLLKDSVIVGDTPNIGNWFKWANIQEDGVRRWNWNAPRTMPWDHRPETPIAGVMIQAEGASHLDSVQFLNFKHTDYRKETAIYWPDSNHHMTGAANSVQKLTFNYADPSEGFYMLESDYQNRTADWSYNMRDLDGSLTGQAGVTVVKPGQYFEEGQKCYPKEGWNMDICEASFVKALMWHRVDVYNGTFLTDPKGNVVKNNDVRISYDMVFGEDRYILNWAQTMENNIWMRILGLEKDASVTIGFCLPMNFVNAIGSRQLRDFFEVEGASCIKEAESLESLKSHEDPDVNFFLDREKGIAYRRFTEQRDRLDGELGECAGALDNLNRCPYIRVKMWGVPDVDYNDGDCRARLGFL